jgi:hypothetical protein
MAPNLASSQHDLIHNIIVDKKLKTRQMANVAKCSKRSIKAIRSNPYYFGTTKAPLNSGRRPRSITPLTLEALCEHLLKKPELYLEEMAVFLWLEDLASGARSGVGRFRARWRLQLIVTCFTVLWVVLLITVDGLRVYTWYLIAIGAIGSFHAVFLSRMHLMPEQVRIPLRYTGISIVENRVMTALKEAEVKMPGLGLALLDNYFPSDLPDSERVFWEERRQNERG